MSCGALSWLFLMIETQMGNIGMVFDSCTYKNNLDMVDRTELFDGIVWWWWYCWQEEGQSSTWKEEGEVCSFHVVCCVLISYLCICRIEEMVVVACGRGVSTHGICSGQWKLAPVSRRGEKPLVGIQPRSSCMLSCTVVTAASNVRVPFGSNNEISGTEKKGEDVAKGLEKEGDGVMKVSMVSLGCPKNTVDGEVLLGDLFRSGFEIIDDHEKADAIVVNTCGFVEDAKAESLENIIQAAQLKENGQVKKVVVTGCLAQRYNDELADQLPEVDLVVGFEKYGGLASAMKDVLGSPPDADDILQYQNRSRVQVGESTVGFRPEWDRFRLTPKHTAYLRVAEGCNHACTFCAIPGFRCVC